VRREELIVKDVPRHIVADGRGRYDRWQLARADARAAGSVPSMAVETVREWTSRPTATDPGLLVDSSAVAVTRLSRPRDDERPRGAGFGSLVHAVLAQAPFEASRQMIANLAAVEARVLNLNDDDAVAASVVAERVWAHEVLTRARAADARGACRRETPVTCVLPDGTLLEGVVDLAFEHDGTWTVVDYKTDREIAALGEERYRRQVALYSSAIAQATGAPCDGIVLVI
jgi:ATP-dependent exoDNAse (exonuclease V) beta subunit